MVNSKIDWSLYAILDKEFIQNRSIPFLAEQVIAAGAGVVQLRDKISTTKEFYVEALAVKEITNQYGIPLIINDRLDIALAANAEGVHLGQSDLPLKAARSIVGADMIIGVSVHNLAEFNAVVKNEPDYFGVGTIFPTNTKNKLQIMGTDILTLLRAKTSLPLVAIGGITVDNVTSVLKAGADGVAVISALLGVEDVHARTNEFVQKINRTRQSLSVA